MPYRDGPEDQGGGRPGGDPPDHRVQERPAHRPGAAHRAAHGPPRVRRGGPTGSEPGDQPVLEPGRRAGGGEQVGQPGVGRPGGGQRGGAGRARRGVRLDPVSVGGTQPAGDVRVDLFGHVVGVAGGHGGTVVSLVL
jgi:hypothetical protein